MAFKVWSESGDNLITDPSQFNDPDTQRDTGFQSNTPASSRYMNSILKQDSLFTTAFLEVLKDRGADISLINYSSNMADVKTILETFVPSKLYRHYFTIWIDNIGSQTVSFEIISRNKNFVIDNSVPVSYPNSNSLSYVTAVHDRVVDALVAYGVVANASGCISGLVGSEYSHYVNKNVEVKSDANVTNVIRLSSNWMNDGSVSSYIINSSFAIYGNNSVIAPDQGSGVLNIQPVRVNERIAEI